jgi:hypothetical protein
MEEEELPFKAMVLRHKRSSFIEDSLHLSSRNKLAWKPLVLPVLHFNNHKDVFFSSNYVNLYA